MPTLTPDEYAALRIWNGLSHSSLTAAQFRLVLRVLLRVPAAYVWSTAVLVQHPDFRPGLLIATARELGPNLQLNLFSQIARAYLLARSQAGASVRELWDTAYPMAVVARKRAGPPSRAPRLERIACTELIETCSDIGIGKIGSACWGDGETAALLHARSRELRQSIAAASLLCRSRRGGSPE
jgi:hypothetical protein